MEENTNIQKCVSAIFINKYKEILIQDHVKLDALTLPGGKVDDGEDESTTIIRELKEELGVDITRYIRIGDILDCGKLEYPAGSNNYCHFTQEFFVILDYAGKITNMEPEKHKSLLWISLDKIHLLKRPISKVLQAIIDDPATFCL